MDVETVHAQRVVAVLDVNGTASHRADGLARPDLDHLDALGGVAYCAQPHLFVLLVGLLAANCTRHDFAQVLVSRL